MANDVLIDMLASLSLDSGAATSPADPGTTLLNDNTKTWPADKFKRCMARIVHGKGAGQQARITGNSASSLSVSPPWIEGLDASSVYVIYQPEVSDQVERILADVNTLSARLTLARAALLDRLALLAAGGAGELTPARAASLDNLDAAVSSRSVPGDAMALTAAERLIVQALVLSDATPFAGALMDAAVSSRAAEDGGRLQDTQAAAADLQASRDRQLFSVDFWSGLQEEVSIPAAAATLALPSVAVSGLPAGATVVRATAMVKFRVVENTNVAANGLDGATVAGTSQVIQVDDSAATGYLDAVNFANGQFSISERIREGGDVLMSSIDVSARVDGNDTYSFRYLLAKTLLDAINWNDVQVGLRILYSV